MSRHVGRPRASRGVLSRCRVVPQSTAGERAKIEMRWVVNRTSARRRVLGGRGTSKTPLRQPTKNDGGVARRKQYELDQSKEGGPCQGVTDLRNGLGRQALGCQQRREAERCSTEWPAGATSGRGARDEASAVQVLPETTLASRARVMQLGGRGPDDLVDSWKLLGWNPNYVLRCTHWYSWAKLAQCRLCSMSDMLSFQKCTWRVLQENVRVLGKQLHEGFGSSATLKLAHSADFLTRPRTSRQPPCQIDVERRKLAKLPKRSCSPSPPTVLPVDACSIRIRLTGKRGSCF